MNKKADSVVVWVKQLAFVMGVVIAVAGPLYFTFVEKYGMATITMAAGLILMLASRFDDLSKVKIGPLLEYELHKKKEEVDKALVELKAFALALSRPSMKMALQTDPMRRTLTRKEVFDLAKNIENSLRRLGVEDEDIRKVTEPYYSRTLYEICWPMNDVVSRVTNKKIAPLAAERNRFHDKQSQEYVDANGRWQEAIDKSQKYKKYFTPEGWSRLPYEIEGALQLSGLFDEDEIKSVMKENRPHIDRAVYFIERRDFKPNDRWLYEY